EARFLHVSKRAKLARCENNLEQSVAAGIAKGCHFLVESFPTAGQDVFSRDDGIDFSSACLDRVGNFSQTQFERTQSCPERSGNRGDGNSGPSQGAECVGYHRRIDTSRGCRKPEPRDIQCCQQIVPEGMPRLCTKPPDFSR